MVKPFSQQHTRVKPADVQHKIVPTNKTAGETKNKTVVTSPEVEAIKQVTITIKDNFEYGQVSMACI